VALQVLGHSVGIVDRSPLSQIEHEKSMVLSVVLVVLAGANVNGLLVERLTCVGGENLGR
jgi:hypothetical protein